MNDKPNPSFLGQKTSHSGKKPNSEEEQLGFDALTDQLRDTMGFDTTDEVNKPDFREIDLGSPISPLRRTSGGLVSSGLTTATSSSSSSSESISGRNAPYPAVRRPDSGRNSHSGELSGSVESSPKSVSREKGLRPGHRRTESGSSLSSHPSIYSGGSSATSPVAASMLPAGNICPSGKILRAQMPTRRTKTDVLGSGKVNYGHGSIMRGGTPTKSAAAAGAGPVNPRSGAGDSARRGTSAADPEELKMKGNEQYRLGNLPAALGFYDLAIAQSPTNATLRFNKAVTLTGIGLLPEAANEYEEAIRSDPHYSKAHHRLGSLLIRLGQVENAKRHISFSGYKSDASELQKLMVIDSHITKCTNARRISDWKSVLRECDAAIAAGADAAPQMHICKAEALLKLQRLEDADSSLTNAPKVELSSSSWPHLKFFGMVPEAYSLFVRAQVEMGFGRFESAVADVEKARAIDVGNVDIQVLLKNVKLVSRARNRGNDLYKSERFTEASAAYDEGLRLDPSNSILYCNRAACWFMLGHWERSIDDCNQALRIYPSYTKALLRRAVSYSKLERWADAVIDYEALRKELPDNTEIAESLFHAQVSLKKSRGEDVQNMKFGGEVELVSGLEQFRSAISSPSLSVVHFKSSTDQQCKRISPLVDNLCRRYPSTNFLKVDVEESPGIASAENVRIVPTFKMYRNGSRVKEMVCPSPEVLESSVRHYSII